MGALLAALLTASEDGSLLLLDDDDDDGRGFEGAVLFTLVFLLPWLCNFSLTNSYLIFVRFSKYFKNEKK
jgi:hypothetical protein